MFSKILDFDVFNGTQEELLTLLEDYEKVNVISGNPEVLMNSIKDEKLYHNFINKQTIIIPDGVGTVIASKIVREPVKGKIAGIELMHSIIQKCNTEGLSIYLLGAKQEILDKCVTNLRNQFPDIEISGYHNGYFDIDNCNEIINDIIKKKPYAIFVAMGSPKQELFIMNYMDKLPCKIYMGVGGSFDIIAGELNRAPDWMITSGLEWLYRVYKEPVRIKRLSSIPHFIIKTVIYRLRGKRK